MRMVTVAAVQMHCSRDVTDNLERAEQLVRQAAVPVVQFLQGFP